MCPLRGLVVYAFRHAGARSKGKRLAPFPNRSRNGGDGAASDQKPKPGWWSNRGTTVAKRTQRGLFGGKNVRFGNNVSEDGGNKTRRKWKPNVQTKRLRSEVLDETYKLQVTPHVMRCIRRFGGLDEYLVRTTHDRLRSDKGSELRVRVIDELKRRGELWVEPRGAPEP